jgi:hypothetical protein
MGERRTVYGVLVGKPEEKRPFERFRHRWEDLQEVEWVDLAEDRYRWWALVSVVMNLQVL